MKYYTKTAVNDDELEHILKKTLTYLEEQKPGQFKSYQDLKEQLKKDFDKLNQSQFIEQTVDIIEQAHATNQFDDIEKVEVQSLMKDRLDGKRMFCEKNLTKIQSVHTVVYFSINYQRSVCFITTTCRRLWR